MLPGIQRGSSESVSQRLDTTGLQLLLDDVFPVEPPKAAWHGELVACGSIMSTEADDAPWRGHGLEMLGGDAHFKPSASVGAEAAFHLELPGIVALSALPQSSSRRRLPSPAKSRQRLQDNAAAAAAAATAALPDAPAPMGLPAPAAEGPARRSRIRNPASTLRSLLRRRVRAVMPGPRCPLLAWPQAERFDDATTNHSTHAFAQLTPVVPSA